MLEEPNSVKTLLKQEFDDHFDLYTPVVSQNSWYTRLLMSLRKCNNAGDTFILVFYPSHPAMRPMEVRKYGMIYLAAIYIQQDYKMLSIVIQVLTYREVEDLIGLTQ